MTRRSTIGAEPGARKPWLWDPWLPSRRATTLDLYRVAAGCLLTAHFAELLGQLPELLDSGALGDALLASDALPSWFAGESALGAAGLARALLATCCALSLGIVLGTAPRLCAAVLFVLSVGLYRSIFPVTTLDDHVACAAAFWLCVLPVGRSLLPWQRPGWRAARHVRVEGWTSCALVVHVLLLQFDVDLWSSFSPTGFASAGTSLAMCLSAACVVAPSAPLRLAGALGLALLHVLLSQLTGLALAHFWMAACVLLLLGEPGPRAEPAPFTTPCALGAAFVALSICFCVAQRAGATSVAQAGARVLGQAGLLANASGQKLARGRRVLQLRARRGTASARSELAARDLTPSVRAELLLGYLEPSRDTDLAVRARIATALIGRYCGDDKAGESGELWLSSEFAEANVAWFECGSAPSAPRVVLARPSLARRDPARALELHADKDSISRRHVATNKERR